MKILILNKCLMMGGIEKVLLETLKNLSELYDDIDLVLKDEKFIFYLKHIVEKIE